jgi:ATP-dependent protease HslVU (ClpYQ) peptidase subunit
MTTIVAMKDRIAADRALTTGNGQVSCTKVFRIGKQLVGLAGSAIGGEKFLKFLRDGKEFEPEKKESFDAIVVDRGDIFLYETTLIPIRIEADFYAIGSGAQYAMGALSAGADIKEAILIAAHHDPDTRGPVDLLLCDTKGKRDR